MKNVLSHPVAGRLARGGLYLAAMVWRRLMVRTTFVAITGSVGKTTAKDCLAAILCSVGRTIKTEGTQNSARDVSRVLLRVRPWHRFAIVEVGTDAPGWIRRSGALVRPDIAVILSVARTHTNRFPTLDDTATEKASLLTTLTRGGIAIVNGDDPRVRAMRPPFRRVLFGSAADADFRASNITSEWPRGLSYDVLHCSQATRVQTHLMGVHWTTSTLAAIAAACHCGVSLSEAAESLSLVQPIPARMQPVLLPGGATMIRDEGNGAIDTFEEALNALSGISSARKLLVITTITDTGESSRERAAYVGTRAARFFDAAVFVGRYAADSKRAAVDAGMLPEAAHAFRRLRKAAEWVRQNIRSGDLVLLRGRGVDHMSRIYWTLVSDIACWKGRCPKVILCDTCEELHRGGNGGSVEIQFHAARGSVR